MKYTEFGKENDISLMVFVGGGVYWDPSGRDFIEEAVKKYHVIMVAYDGFDGANRESKAPESNIYEHEGKCAARFIENNLGGKIDIMYGISAGAWVLLEAIHCGNFTVHTAVVDGMNMKSEPKWQRGNLSNITANIVYKSVTDPKFAEKVTGQKWEDLEKKICTWVTKDTWKRLCAANCGYEIKFDSFKKAKFHVWYGDKGSYDKSFIKAAGKKIGDISEIEVRTEKNCGHGGLFAEPERLVKALTAAYNNEKDYVV